MGEDEKRCTFKVGLVGLLELQWRAPLQWTSWWSFSTLIKLREKLFMPRWERKLL
jgi:hypothetical protein